MVERPIKPSKQVKVSSAPSDHVKVSIQKGQPDPKPADQSADPKTLADYVPPSMDDPGIDKAIDDIIVSESNEVLAAEDSMYRESSASRPKKKKQSRFKIIKSKWLYIGLGLVIIGVLAWPSSRYLIFGEFIKKDYKFVVIDSVTKEPISGAKLSVANESTSTNAYGQAELKLSVGRHMYSISKHYYASSAGYIFVGISKAKADNIQLKATGRTVPLTVINKLTGRLLAGVQISVLNTTAITNSSGQASIVLPTKKTFYEGTVKANGFNTLITPIQVTTSKKANVISMIPVGSVYFLSNATGDINVIKANLDGSNPTIELAATGKETSSTKLIPSPDGKYLILEAQRTGSQPELYVINTSSGNLTEFDSSADNFTLIGWSSDMFIYDELSSSADTSMAGREQLKSYNATTNQLNVLDQNQVVGSSPSYGYQSFANFELLPDLVVYTTNWTAVNGYDISTQSDTIRSIEPSGLNKKDYTTFQASLTGTITVVRNLPESLYLSVNNTSTNQTTYYSFANGSANTASITAATFSASYPTYFVSPSGEVSLWTTNQNGTLETFTANQNGQNSKRLIIPAGYSVYGWYDNVYILLTNNSKLYIAPATGSNLPILIGSYLAS